MVIFGVVLIFIGLLMAWSGFAAKWRMKNLQRITVDTGERGYHMLFRRIWWLPVGLGIVLIGCYSVLCIASYIIQ
jgi:hypothetical protein